MKVCVVGATGLLGYQASLELIERGHSVVGVALAPVPEGLKIPKEMDLHLGSYLEMGEGELQKIFKGCDGFVFAAGVDERVEGPPPIYDLYKKFNIDELKRLMDVARKAKVTKVVVLGSYFSYFARKWSRLRLTKHHPYIRARIEQEKLAASYAKGGMDVAVLELPYIFGAQKNRKPVWMFIAEMIQNTKGKVMFYPKGGTTMVTVRQVGECVAGALEFVKGYRAYPVGWFNMRWEEWLEKFSADMGMPKKVVSIPNFLYRAGARKIMREMREKGVESGLEMREFSRVMTAETFIDKAVIRDELGVRDDDIDAAIRESAEVCLDIMRHPEKKVVGMKGE